MMSRAGGLPKWVRLGELILLLSFLVLLVLLISQACLLPIYPDEVAYKIFLERFFLNGEVKQSVTPFCMEGFRAHVPLPLLPAAVAWSALQTLGIQWMSFRLVPLVALGGTIGLLVLNSLRCGDAGIWRPLLLLGLGPALYGLVILRPEILVIFAGVVLFFVNRTLASQHRAGAVTALILLNAAIFCAIAYVHPKALYLTPLVLLGMIFGCLNLATALQRWGLLAVGFMLMVGLVSSALSLHRLQFLDCPDVPAIQDILRKQSVNLLTAFSDPEQFSDTLQAALSSETWSNTIEKLQFQADYEVNYLPANEQFDGMANWVNGLILIIFAVALAYIVLKILCVGMRRSWAERRELALICALAAAFLFPAVANLTRHWYETSFLVGAIAVIAALLYPIKISEKPFGPALLIANGIAGTALAIGAVMTFLVIRTHLSEPLKTGFAGTSAFVKADPGDVSRVVASTVAKYGIDPRQAIIVDDMTYGPLRSHPIVVPITYLGHAISRLDVLATSLRKISAHVSLTACDETEALKKIGWSTREETFDKDGGTLFCLLTDESQTALPNR
jgi:hypothetical protein